MASSQSQKQVPLYSLPLQTLSRLQQQLTSELTHLSDSHARLRLAQSRFRDCVVCIQKTNIGTTGATTTNSSATGKQSKTQLIPLTTSLYVPATPSSSNTVLVDIGTGFYVEKSPEEGIKFYEGKVKALEESMKRVEDGVRGKTETLRGVEGAMRRAVVNERGQGGEQEVGADDG